MSINKADAISGNLLETRIDLRASPASVKPSVPFNWDDCEVIPLKQSGLWGARELLFVELGSELKPIGM